VQNCKYNFVASKLKLMLKFTGVKDLLQNTTVSAVFALCNCMIHFTMCRIIGFDDIGNSDDFQTAVLERRFQSSGKRTSL